MHLHFPDFIHPSPYSSQMLPLSHIYCKQNTASPPKPSMEFKTRSFPKSKHLVASSRSFFPSLPCWKGLLLPLHEAEVPSDALDPISFLPHSCFVPQLIAISAFAKGPLNPCYPNPRHQLSFQFSASLRHSSGQYPRILRDEVCS